MLICFHIVLNHFLLIIYSQDFSFLKHGPLAESTSQLPQDVLRSVHANIGKDHQDANRRPSEFIDRPTISQPQNKKDEIFLTPAAPKPFNPSWQISKQEPSKQVNIIITGLHF